MRRSKPSILKSEQKRDAELSLLMRDYADRTSPQHGDASQQVDDLAYHQPELFWRFLELVVASDIPLSNLGDIGWGPLTWLLRRYPDDWAERVTGLSKREARMLTIVRGIDRDRIAPDIVRLVHTVAG